VGSLKHEIKTRGQVTAMDLNPTDLNPDTGFGIISKYSYTGGFRDVGEARGGRDAGGTQTEVTDPKRGDAWPTKTEGVTVLQKKG